MITGIRCAASEIEIASKCHAARRVHSLPTLACAQLFNDVALIGRIVSSIN